LLKFPLNDKTVMSIKYEQLNIVIWSVVLWSFVCRRYMWWIV